MTPADVAADQAAQEEVALERRATEPHLRESRNARYLAAVVGVALVTAILAMETPGTLSAPSGLSEASQP